MLFVDGAHDGPSWRMGGFSEFLGVRSYVARRLRAQSQQLVELQSLCWGVRLAVALGYATVTLVSDSEVAPSLSYMIRPVLVQCVPTPLANSCQPAHPPSSLWLRTSCFTTTSRSRPPMWFAIALSFKSWCYVCAKQWIIMDVEF